MGVKNARSKLASFVKAGYLQNQTARPVVETASWLALKNAIMETKQDAYNVQWFLGTNVLEELARNQAALSHVEMA
jgi:hypothetical protein